MLNRSSMFGSKKLFLSKKVSTLNFYSNKILPCKKEEISLNNPAQLQWAACFSLTIHKLFFKKKHAVGLQLYTFFNTIDANVHTTLKIIIIITFSLVLFLAPVAFSQTGPHAAKDNLYAGFITPSNAARPRVWWALDER